MMALDYQQIAQKRRTYSHPRSAGSHQNLLIGPTSLNTPKFTPVRELSGESRPNCQTSWIDAVARYKVPVRVERERERSYEIAVSEKFASISFITFSVNFCRIKSLFLRCCISPSRRSDQSRSKWPHLLHGILLLS